MRLTGQGGLSTITCCLKQGLFDERLCLCAGLLAAGMLCMMVSASITLSQVMIQPPTPTTGAAEMLTTQSILPPASAGQPAGGRGGGVGDSVSPECLRAVA